MTVDKHDRGDPTVAIRRRRFRIVFGTLLVLITMTSVWIGQRFDRERSTAAIVARQVAIVDVIDDHFLVAPDGTQFNSSLKQRQYQSFKNKQNPSFWNNYIFDDRFEGTYVRGDSLDISGLLENGSVSAASNRLLSHFEKGLSTLGLQQSTVPDGGATMWIVWRLREQGISVTIDLEINASKKQATVRIYMRHSEPLTLW